MSLFPEYPPLQIIRIAPGFQHPDVMVGFDQQHIQVFQAFDCVIAVTAHVCSYSRCFSVVPDPVTDRLRRIMGNVKRPDLQVSDHERFIRPDGME